MLSFDSEIIEEPRVNGSKIYPDEENLFFYSNGHQDISAYFRFIITKCDD